MMNIQNLGLTESVGYKFNDSVCAELCLKLWFESDWHFYNITESKQLSRNKVLNNHFLKSVQKQPYRDVFRNFAIFTRKDLCWSPFGPATLLRRLQHRCFPVNIENFLRTAFFIEHLRRLLLSALKSNGTVMGICRPSLLNQEHKLGRFLWRRFTDLLKVEIINIKRSRFNTFLLINLQKKTCPK